MRVALAQFTAGPDKEANLDRMAGITAEAAGAGAALMLFPECAMAHLPDRPLTPAAEPVDGPFVRGLAAAARRHRVAVVAGIFEAIPGADHVFNTVVALDAAGARLGTYRKLHMYDAFGFRESDRMRAGDGDTLLFTVAGTVFGVQTCYDVRFPEFSRHLAASGAEVILLPSAWVHGLLKESHWEVLVRARAIENTVYVAAAGQAGRSFTGSSMLVDPMGVAVARAGDVDALLVGEVDGERIRSVRRRNPSLENARPDVYARWTPLEAGSPRS